MDTYIQASPSWKIFLLWLVTHGIPELVIIILAIVFGTEYWNNNCGGTMMPLPIWLVVLGSVATVALVVSGITIFFKDDEYGLHVLGSSLFTFGVFLIIWNIVGAVALFRDSSECKKVAKPLWNVVLAILIIQWILMCIYCCCGTYSHKKGIHIEKQVENNSRTSANV